MFGYWSLALSLVIVLVISGLPANGFTIRKIEPLRDTHDVNTGESSFLQIKQDLNVPNDLKALDIVKPEINRIGVITTDDFDNVAASSNTHTTAVLPATSTNLTTQETEVATNNASTTITQAEHSIKVGNDELKIQTNNISIININNENSNETEKQELAAASNDMLTTAIPNENIEKYEREKTETERRGSSIDSTASTHALTVITETGIDMSETSTIQTNVPSELMPPKSEKNTFTIEDIAYTTRNNSKPTDTTTESTQTSPTIKSDGYTTEVTITTTENIEVIKNVIIEDNKTVESKDVPTVTQANEEILDKAKTILNESEVIVLSTEESVLTPPSNDTSDIFTISSTTTVKATDDTISHELNTKIINSTNNDITTTEQATTEQTSTETTYKDTTTEGINDMTLPSWKVYKTIDRKRTSTSTEEATTLDMEMTRAETGRITLEKVLNNTPIPSLEELKKELLNIKEYSTTRLDALETSGMALSSPTTLESSTFEHIMTESVPTQKIDVFSSKRAGYRDNIDRTSPQASEATLASYMDTEAPNYTEGPVTVYDIGMTDIENDVSEAPEVSDLEKPETKNLTSWLSQNQLNEDAIKEEMLAEKTLQENEENTRQRDDTLIVSRGPTKLNGTATESTSEELLSVKPIHPEKRKNSSIYDNSNYKPLKKLDVQPSKPFVRDPDDNSWRNESISSLGIVFKPKNASKSFTEVLKNKTTELSNLTESSKSDPISGPGVEALRSRLSKITEERKSKKRINKFGDMVYSDYEENSGEQVPKEITTSTMAPSEEASLPVTTPLSPSAPTPKPEVKIDDTTKEKVSSYIFKEELKPPLTTVKANMKNIYNLAEYYDATEDDDADYITLADIDLKKFTMPIKPTHNPATHRPLMFSTRLIDLTNTPPITYLPDRQPTVQYFPPTKKVKTTKVTQKQKVNFNDYDDHFKDKLNLFTYKATPKVVSGMPHVTEMPVPISRLSNKITTNTVYTSDHPSNSMVKPLYSNQQRVGELQGGFIANDINFHRPSYVIKHYKDFIHDAAQTSEDDATTEYPPYTELPVQGVTMADVAKFNLMKGEKNDEYEYDSHFRKEIVDRFVDNFNQNSERFKVDFPILYNSSIVHRKVDENGKVLASSSAFMKRLYETGRARGCDPNCESMAVDLSPAYELHYYVPDQEEKEVADRRPQRPPYQFRL